MKTTKFHEKDQGNLDQNVGTFTSAGGEGEFEKKRTKSVWNPQIFDDFCSVDVAVAHQCRLALANALDSRPTSD